MLAWSAVENGGEPMATGAAVAGPRRRIQQVAAASVGNAVEWYDWLSYSYLAVYFADQIFPRDGGRLTPLLGAFAVFAVGFAIRPVGGLVLGAYADRQGRRAALVLTIALMGVGQLVMASMPTYDRVGLLAPILLTVARLVQGMSVGGEFAVSAVFLVESAAPNRRGLFSSFGYVSSSLGQLLAAGTAALLATVLTEAAMHAWAWRVPFAIGAVLCAVAFWIRHGTAETYPLTNRIRGGQVARPRLLEPVVHYPRQTLLVVGMTLAATVIFYTWTTFLPTYAQITVGFDPGNAATIGTLALALFTVLQPFAGMLSDRVGRKPLLVVFGAGFTLLTVPMLKLLNNSFWSLLLIMCFGMVLLTCYTAIAAAVMVELFPARVRTAGIGLPYSLTVALFGGTAPYLATLLIEHGRAGWFGWYVTVLALVSTVIYVAMRETRDRPLDGASADTAVEMLSAARRSPHK